MRLAVTILAFAIFALGAAMLLFGGGTAALGLMAYEGSAFPKIMIMLVGAILVVAGIISLTLLSRR